MSTDISNKFITPDSRFKVPSLRNVQKPAPSKSNYFCRLRRPNYPKNGKNTTLPKPDPVSTPPSKRYELQDSAEIRQNSVKMLKSVVGPPGPADANACPQARLDRCRYTTQNSCRWRHDRPFFVARKSPTKSSSRERTSEDFAST